MIYLDNAATTKQKPSCVAEALLRAINTMGNSSRGAYDESLESDRVIYNARKRICELFNGDNPRQVAFTKNSTEALNIAIAGIFNEGDHIITSEMEHNSVLRPLYRLERERGCSIDYLRLDSKGNLKVDELEGLIKENTRGVVINHASNVTGNMTDLKHIGEICSRKGILLIVDASQTAGAFDIDMKAMNIDCVCFTGHKSLYGPQGTGGLCVREGLYIRPFIIGGSGVDTYSKGQPDSMPTRLEGGTMNSHSIAGLCAALEYIEEHTPKLLTQEARLLAGRFYNALKDEQEIKFYGNYDDDYRAPIVSLNIGNMDSSEVSAILAEEYEIATRSGAHCAPLLHKALNTVDQGMVRFSFSHMNTVEEVDAAIGAVKQILRNGGK